MSYEDYLIREANEGTPTDWDDNPVEWCNQCERALELCVCETDTASRDRQDLINNLSGGAPCKHGASTKDGLNAGLVQPNNDAEGNLPATAQTFPDTWEDISAQLDHWADMDRWYWQQRREKEYAAWMERTYGV